MQLPDLFSRRYTKILLVVPLLFCFVLVLLTFNLVPAVRIPYVSPTPPKQTSAAPPPPPPPPPPIPKDYYTWQTKTSFRPHALAAEYHNSTATDGNPLCAGFPTHKLDTIQIALKTGACASKEKLAAQLSSVCACIPNLLLFSDLDEAIPHPSNDGRVLRTHDVLAELPASYADDNPDWSTYWRQKRAKASDGGVGAASQEGWKLDRFKFLPMVERAWQLRPEREWYVFVEDDTYVVWDNLFRFLDRFAPDSVRYIGSPSPGRHTDEGQTTWFAYGGTGFVLSRGAMRQLLRRDWDEVEGVYTEPSISERFEDAVKGDCCGDSVLGWALWEKGVRLSGHWPMFNPHSVEGVPYSDLYWCQPVITMHRVPAVEMGKLWAWEQEKREQLGPDQPLLYRHLSTYFPLLAAPTRPDWDNAQWDAFRAPDPPPSESQPDSPHDSFEACGHACHQHDKCFQYNFHDATCTFVSSMRFGFHREPDEERARGRWMAGWDTEKMREWMEGRRCEEAEWVRASLQRIF
ncbi:glycosyltransferase family 31 protein [Saccharata proteae CBS 121410]|uniref:N-acetylgalactosaminide beta-1,3-galactosyltransferase n=1 Tax=Saccharata proteae CBS 121410 TaxID=1314787 RepID=A0A9P4HYW1_9PEZI|nr:glycosyltransferase family 31 protein [Saccharata proteae CBS 121410]